MKFTLSIYLGSGVQPTPSEEITTASTKAAITACRQRALRIWPKVARCYVGKDVASYGPPEGSPHSDAYVTLRRIQPD